jgi:hypothetical protein
MIDYRADDYSRTTAESTTAKAGATTRKVNSQFRTPNGPNNRNAAISLTMGDASRN